MLLTGILNLIFPDYAVAFVEWTASCYPGEEGPAGFGSVLVVILYGLVDGAVFGWLLVWLYDRFAVGETAGDMTPAPHRAEPGTTPCLLRDHVPDRLDHLAGLP